MCFLACIDSVSAATATGTKFFWRSTVITLNIGTPRPATVVVLNMKQFNFTLK